MLYDVLGNENLVPPVNSEQLQPSNSINPGAPGSNQYPQYAIPPAQADHINPIDRLFCNLGGVGYEGLMVGWMGSGINTPVAGGQTSENVMPAVQNTWKQEW
jgi:hypothetical protein